MRYSLTPLDEIMWKRPGPLAALMVMVALTASASEARAQCGPGTAIHKGCLGVGYAGCCEVKETQIGGITVVQWCENGYLCQLICNPLLYLETAWCGWVPEQNLYNCTYDTIEEPTGQHPYFCEIPCGDIPTVGCCEGQTLLKTCKGGSLGIVNCAANAEGLQFCGWDPVHQYYGCSPTPVEGPPQHPYACGEVTCTPQCQGKDCGPDGCGASCGTCGGDYVCNEAQKCVTPPCQPECTNKECGPDLCSGTCGQCTPPAVCSAFYKCVSPGEDVALLPDLAEDVVVVPDIAPDPGTGPDKGPQVDDGPKVDPGKPTGDGSQINLDVKNPNLCPDGFISSYGKCVTGPPADDEGGSGTCSFHSRGGSTNPLGVSSLVLAALGLLWVRRLDSSRYQREGET